MRFAQQTLVIVIGALDGSLRQFSLWSGGPTTSYTAQSSGMSAARLRVTSGVTVDGNRSTAYKEGEYIVREGARGDTFFIIAKGRVSV